MRRPAYTHDQYVQLVLIAECNLHVDPQSAAFISLPAFPLGVDPVRLQRVVSSMIRFGLLPKKTNLQITSMITG